MICPRYLPPNTHPCWPGQILAPYIALSDNIIQNALVLQLFLTMFSALLVFLHQPDETLISDVEDNIIVILGSVCASCGLVLLALTVRLAARWADT